MTVRARVRAWWRGPGLAVPTLGEAGVGEPPTGTSPRNTDEGRSGLASRSLRVPASPNAGLAALFGHTRGVRVIVQSPSGLDIPITRAAGWTVLDVAAYLAAVDALPTIEPGSWRA